MSAASAKCAQLSDTLRNEARYLDDAAKRVSASMMESMTGVREVREIILKLESQLEQIARVCRDNAEPPTDARKALNFVLQVATRNV